MSFDSKIEVEDLSRSLIREFLIKSNLKKTLETFNQEDKRPRASITKLDLIKYLAIEKLVRLNKEAESQAPSSAFKTLIEIILSYLHGKFLTRRQGGRESANTSIYSRDGKQESEEKKKSFLTESKPAEVEKPVGGFMRRPSTGSGSGSGSGGAGQSAGASGGQGNSSSEGGPNSEEANGRQFKRNSGTSVLPPFGRDKGESSASLGGGSGLAGGSSVSTSGSDGQNSQAGRPPANVKTFNFMKKREANESTSSTKDNSAVNISQDGPEKVGNSLPSRKSSDSRDNNSANRQPKDAEESKENSLFTKTNKKIEPQKKNTIDFMDELDDAFGMGGLDQAEQGEKEKKNDSSLPKKRATGSKKEDRVMTSSLKEALKYKPINLFEQIDFENISSSLELKSFDYSKNPQMKRMTAKRKLIDIDADTSARVKKLLFGQSYQGKFLPSSWQQGFIFNANADNFFGLHQKDGGPCGILASVQAYYLKHFFFVSSLRSMNPTSAKVGINYKINCLLAGLAELLWRCRDRSFGNSIKIVLTDSSGFGNAVSIDNCGYVALLPKNVEELFELLQEYRDDFIGESNNGVALFLYSVILTKGVANLIKEMDNEDNNVIGLHGHCTQELVNLFLTGKATSNTFDGENDMGEGYSLKGVYEQSEFGFLTLFEHYRYMVVGRNLKTPRFPIWIICKEYHYSVVFSNQMAAVTEEGARELRKFDVVFYDGLHHHKDFIRLTISMEDQNAKARKKPVDEDLIPSLNLVLMTKWGKSIEVDWNETTPIL